MNLTSISSAPMSKHFVCGYRRYINDPFYYYYPIHIIQEIILISLFLNLDLIQEQHELRQLDLNIGIPIKSLKKT